MTHHQRDYETYLREQGFRVTPQRQVILDAVCAGCGHTTVQEIYARVQDVTPAVNLATVYRTLDFLTQVGLIVAADIGGQTVYEIAGERPHHHLVCTVCGGQEQISHSALAALFSTIADEHGFTVTVDHLALTGVCRTCASRQTG